MTSVRWTRARRRSEVVKYRTPPCRLLCHSSRHRKWPPQLCGVRTAWPLGTPRRLFVLSPGKVFLGVTRTVLQYGGLYVTSSSCHLTACDRYVHPPTRRRAWTVHTRPPSATLTSCPGGPHTTLPYTVSAMCAIREMKRTMRWHATRGPP